MRGARILAAVAVLLAAAHAPAQAQRIGLVSTTFPGPDGAFFAELARRGYEPGRNLIIESRYARGELERVPALVAEVLGAKVEVLVVSSTAGAQAARKATSTVPVVFVNVSDPVGQGLVASLARPGGNLTGTTFGVAGTGLGQKWVELLREAAPQITHVALLWNSKNAGSARHVPEIESAAAALGLRLSRFDAGDAAALDRALAGIRASGAQALVLAGDPFLNASRRKIVQFAAAERLPAIYFFAAFVEEGGLMSYGWILEEAWRRAAAQTDRILKGARPADIPVEQPTRSELVVNLKAARAIGLKLPQSLLIRADRVIE